MTNFARLYFPEIFELMLKERGVLPDQEEEFINPDYNLLHDPMLLTDMERARDRVIKAVRDGEHIAIFSDYDADGIPGAVVLSDFFSRIKYENISFYIPHRHDEGFGMNLSAVDEIAERGTKLIITVDCGIADHKEVARANELGMEVIITDHHEPSSVIPEAYAIINPKRKDSIYPFKELCGSGVAYKLVQGILLKESFGLKSGMEKWSLDMVGIATLSDCVPLLGENRILARFGLDVLRKSPRPGLEALFKKLNLNQKMLSEDDIAFMITPRINAASRMGSPEDAFNLLRATDPSEAQALALHLEKINNERKGVVASLVKEAKAHLLEREEIGKVIVIGNPEWRPSLLGLVANSLVEEYSRPVFVWGRDGDGTLKGSCRSYNGYDLYVLMSDVKDEFIEFGGHAGAGGFSTTLENLVTLEQKLSKAFENNNRSTEEKKEESSIVMELKDIGENLWSMVSLFSPFGTDNPKPVFKFPSTRIRSVRKFGKEGNHLELTLDAGNREVKAISFFSTPESFGVPLAAGLNVDLHAHLEKSYFRNRPELRLRIVDIIGS